MTVVTIDGQLGAGAPEIGRLVARAMQYDFRDRLVLVGAAKRLGATVEAVSNKQYWVDRKTDWIWRFAEKVMSSLAMGSIPYEPYLGTMNADLLPATWDESLTGPRASHIELTVDEIGGAIRDEITEISSNGNVVIVHRAGCVEISGPENLLRVGLFAPWNQRVNRLMSRESFKRFADAERALESRERSQIAYFKKFHGVHPHNTDLYDVNMETSAHNIEDLAGNIVKKLKASLVRNSIALAGT